MTTKKEVLKAIRLNCIDCSCGNDAEVRRCEISNCPLYPFRFGKDPNPAKGGKNPFAGGN